MGSTVQRLAVALALLLLCTAVPAVAATDAASPAQSRTVSWAAAEIEVVAAAGLLGGDAAGFRPDDPLLHGELHDALVRLDKPVKAPTDPTRPVTIRELDARLVTAVGLSGAAKQIRAAAEAAGLKPRPSLGTETMARLLGFRADHPFGQDDLERGLADPASRADAAYSLAKLMATAPGNVVRLKELAGAVSFPVQNDWQRAVLTRALRLVGSPYVWAGTSELPQPQLAEDGVTSVTVSGGFDCSGFVWRVFKLQPIAGGPRLAEVLKGRSSYDMAGEVPVSRRVTIDAIQPGDVVFFAERGPAAKPADVGHMGIYAGGGWMVHSSRNGVTLEPMHDWYRGTFAWARRPLAEAGLTT
jgi:cell wall-associated NlpC family hydrolase